jgi:hypothetical protein
METCKICKYTFPILADLTAHLKRMLTYAPLEIRAYLDEINNTEGLMSDAREVTQVYPSWFANCECTHRLYRHGLTEDGKTEPCLDCDCKHIKEVI